MTRAKTRHSIAPVLAFALATLAGCAGIQSSEYRLLVSGLPYEIPEPGSVLETMDDAAIAALAHARAHAGPAEREALLIGSIVRVENGYSWIAPRHSGSYFQSVRGPVARMAPSEAHVATYVVHPKTGDSRIDRLNEYFTPSEKKVVDRADPLHRPMFLLTPSGRIVSYFHAEPIVEIADLRRGRVKPPTDTAIASR